MHLLKSLARAALILPLALSWAGDDERAQDLFQQHRWFELRGLKPTDPFGAAFIQGVLGLAFNRPWEAEVHLKLAVHLAKSTEQLNAAREKLGVLYLRQGRLHDATLQLRAILKRDPSREDSQSLMDLFGPLAASGNLSVRLPKGGATFPCEVKPDGVWVSLSVNGKNVTWLLDTGFNFAATSESDAQSLGIVVYDRGGVAGDSHAKSGVAAKITIGGMEFRNVPLLIFPDAQPPWQNRQKGRRGVVGIPVAIAMQTLSWTRDGVCRAAFEPAERGAPNLAFDDFNPVVRSLLNGKPVDWLLDTGDQAGSQLWTRFKAEFPDVVAGEGVSTGSMQVTPIGAGNDRPTTVIPELKFDVGGMAAILRPAYLFSKPVGNGYQHGLLGMDVFSQAREIAIDFRSMTLTAR